MRKGRQYRRGKEIVVGARLLVLALLGALAVVLSASAAVGSNSRAAAPPYVADSVLVRFVPGTPGHAKASARESVGGELDAELTLVPGLERLKVHGRSVDGAVAALSKNPNVVYAEPDYVVSAIATPNDPFFPQLWGMAKINAPAAWDVSTGSTNVVVGDVDTGIDYSHPDLGANVWVNPGEIAGNGLDDDGNGYVDDIHGWDWANNDADPLDDHFHGTHTAGTIGARGNNGVGVVGVNWNVWIAGLKFLNAQGSGSTSNAILALNYATAKGMRVTNNSWGGGGFSQGLYDAITAARNSGSLFVAAAGNNGFNNDLLPFYPASYNLDNLIAVAATTSADGLASFSNYGATSVDLGAPGVGVLSTVPGGYDTYSGTSMATPHVSGAAALLLAVNPTWTYAQVRDRIFCTARPLAALAGKTATGGMLDIGAALGSGTCGALPPPPPAATMHVGDVVVTAKRKGKTASATATVSILDANGNAVGSAMVTGDWYVNNSEPVKTSSAATSGGGVASFSLGGVRSSSPTLLTFCVDTVTHPSFTFEGDPNQTCDGALT
jgi:subtilisin family serine protease